MLGSPTPLKIPNMGGRLARLRGVIRVLVVNNSVISKPDRKLLRQTLYENISGVHVCAE